LAGNNSPGLPDGFFSHQKSKFGYVLEDVGNVDLYCCHLEHFMTIWYILWAFGNFIVILYIFPRFGKLRQEKSGNPGIYQQRETVFTLQ
jgi:hypothetical protein